MPEGSNSSSYLLIFMVLAVVVLFFMNSRARKRQSAAVAFRDTLAPGQEVMTSAGMFGTVVSVDGDKVTLVNSGGQESVWLLAAIAKLVDDEPALDADDSDTSSAPDELDEITDRPIVDEAVSGSAEETGSDARAAEGTIDDAAPQAGTDPRDDTTR